MLPSSTSSSSARAAGATLVERPRVARSLWIALAICAVFRLAIEPLQDLPKPDRHEDLYDFLVVERFFIDEIPAPPEVLVLGSSISMYDVDVELLAHELGVDERAVRGLWVPAGAPWDAAALLRRNPHLLDAARVALFDVQPYMFNANYEHAVPSRFYNLATLSEAAALPGLAAVRAVANRLWPFVSFRRPLRAWVMQLQHWLDGTTPLEASTHYPDWHPKAKYHAETEADLFRSLSSPKFQPRGWADTTLENWDFSERQAGELVALVRELRGRGIEVFIHQAPFHPDFWARGRERPETAAAVDRYFAFLDELRAEGAHVKVWMDPRELGFSPEELPDYGHQTRRLAALYTHALARELREAGVIPHQARR